MGDTEDMVVCLVSSSELSEIRQLVADLREHVDRQLSRFQSENDLIRAEIRATQEMIGALMASVAKR